jgi:hypothetical protein
MWAKMRKLAFIITFAIASLLAARANATNDQTNASKKHPGDCLERKKLAACAIAERAGIHDPLLSHFACSVGAALIKADSPQVTCDASYKLEKSRYDLMRFSAPPSDINGIQFPTNTRTHYRGMVGSSTQVDVTRVTGAILGAPGQFLETRIFSELKDVLLHRLEPGARKVKLPEGQDANLRKRLETLQQCGHFDQQNAAIYAADLLDKAFSEMGDVARDRYADNFSGQFQEWGTESVFSTGYQMLAQRYGKNVLEIRENNPRSVDKNYREYKLGGHGFEQHHPNDLGEIISAGYVAPEDMTGLLVHGEEPVYGGDPKGIAFALEKIEIKGKLYALVVDPEGSTCIERGPDDQFYACNPNYPNPYTSDLKPMPIIDTSKKLKIMAVVESCTPGKSCKPPFEVFAKYGTSKTELPKSVLEQLSLADSPTGATGLFPPGEANPILRSSAIQIHEAFYGANQDPTGNVTPTAASIIDGKESIQFRVDYRQLGDPAPGKLKSFELKWTCSNAPAKVEQQLVMDDTRQVLPLGCAAGATLKVVEATYAGNLLPHSKPVDVTHAFKSECENLMACHTLINNTQLGDPAPGVGKTLKVNYSCAGNPDLHTYENAAGSPQVSFECQ